MIFFLGNTDMAIAVPSIAVSTYDILSVENSLNSLFAVQNTSTGQLPYAGKPFPQILSFTYHLYTLIGVADHYLYTVRATHFPTHCHVIPRWYTYVLM
jgi:hypothetical protein